MFTQTRRPMSIWALLATLCLPSVGLGQAPSHPREEILSRFAQRLADQVGVNGVGGITAGVVVRNDLVWAQGFGWADMEEKSPRRSEHRL